MDREFELDYYSSIYYDPESAGLELVYSVDIAGPWEFEMLGIWKDLETGNIYYGFDSGCSCPSPFEDVHSLSGLTRIDPNNPQPFIDEVESWNNTSYRGGKMDRAELAQVFIRVAQSFDNPTAT